MGFPTSFGSEARIAQNLVKQCEEFEISTLSDHQELQSQREHQYESVLVMEMAALLYLGRVNEAFFLWRRTVHIPFSHNQTSDVSNNMNDVSEESSRTGRSANLDKLWKVGAAMLRHDSTTAFNELNVLKQQMTLAPPLTFEIISNIEAAYRDRICHILCKAYSMLSPNVAASKLGFESSDEAFQYLSTKHGWTTSNTGFFIPASNELLVSDDENLYNAEQNIATLTDIVSFLERKRFSA